jgi:hypothetical protein
LLFFVFPETKFKGAVVRGDVSPPSLDDSKETADHIENGTFPSAVEVEMQRKVESQFEEQRAYLGVGKPTRSQFQLIQRPDANWKSFLIRDIIAPIRCFILPIVFWAGLMVAGPANNLLLFNMTLAITLGAPPYNWNGSQIGYANFAFVGGGIIGLLTAGRLSDWIAARATRRNGGIREAEMRLPALIPFVILSAVGLVVAGVGFTYHWPWAVVVILGYGGTGLSVTSVPTIAIAYAIDCYKPISGEIMVVATVLKNTCGFVMSYWVFTEAAKGGMIRPTMIQFALTMGPALLTIPIYFYGKSLRRLTRNSPWHTMNEI